MRILETISFDKCARCGEPHKNVTFKPLARPMPNEPSEPFTHWAPCPTNGEPLLCRFKPPADLRRNAWPVTG